MRSFTVKDLILYNSPCFNCKGKISFSCIIKTGNDPSVTSVKPFVFDKNIEIILENNFRSQLKLIVDGVSNKFGTNSMPRLTKFMEGHKLFFDSLCLNCCTRIISDNLSFNFDKKIILPVQILHETLNINDGGTVIVIKTSFKKDKSLIIVDKIDSEFNPTITQLNTKIIPLYNFQNKESLLKKIKTYLLFS